MNIIARVLIVAGVAAQFITVWWTRDPHTSTTIGSIFAWTALFCYVMHDQPPTRKP